MILCLYDYIPKQDQYNKVRPFVNISYFANDKTSFDNQNTVFVPVPKIMQYTLLVHDFRIKSKCR